MRRVFGFPVEPARALAPHWMPFAFFEGERCVASVEATALPMVIAGADQAPTAIRRVATDPDWRGQGLFRALIGRALAWCASRSTDPCLLYTAEPDIYARFGFLPVAQHAFVGPVVPVSPAVGMRIVDVARPHDRLLVEALLARRTPVSHRCAMLAPALFMEHVLAAEDLDLHYNLEHDCLVVSEADDDDGLIIVDVVAAQVPLLEAILATAGGCPSGRLKTLFPPDRLGWDGSAVLEDTGLMMLGEMPAALTRPFMLPPTTEF